MREERPDIIIEMDAITSGIFREPAEEIGCPVIVMSHFDAGTIIKNLSKEERMALDASDIVQVLMPSDMTAFRKVLTKAKLIRIANIVPQYEQTEGHAKRKESLLIDVARLDKKQKRQHLLIKAFAEIAPEFPKWKLELWGEEQGSEKPYTKELEDLLYKYHLEGQVKLCGNTDDVLSVYRRASIFAFPSAFEGFPLAMTEAMSAGLPVVAYRSCPAVNELVEDGKTGLLVEDGVDALAEGLRKLMNDQAMREEMGRAAHEAMKAYAPEKIWDQWEELMKDVVANHASRK